MSGVLIYLILFAVLFSRLPRQGKGNGSGSGKGSNTAGRTAPTRRAAGRRPLASDGHRVSKEDDISCRRYGHDHEEFDTPRFIPHNDPEEGYIILNGVKMKLSEADRYEDRI